jgi:hypothetical protein
MLKPHFLKASALAVAVAFFGGSSTVYHRKGDGLAIYAEPDQVATR